MFDRHLIRWLSIVACMPQLLLASLSGNAVLFHDHDDHGLHVHVRLDEADTLSGTNAANPLGETHGHPDAQPAHHRHDGSALDESTSLFYFVVLVDFASPRRGDFIKNDAAIQVYARLENGIAPRPGWPPPGARTCPLDSRAGGPLAMILRSNNAILI